MGCCLCRGPCSGVLRRLGRRMGCRFRCGLRRRARGGCRGSLREVWRHRLDFAKLIVEDLAHGGRRVRRLLRHGVEALLHILTKHVEIDGRLLNLLAHRTRSVVELTADLLQLPADLSNDRLEIALEVVDGTGRVSLCFLTQLVDLRERLLNLSGGIPAKRGRDLLGARLCLGEGVFHQTRVIAHHAIELLRLGVHRLEQRNDGLVAAFQDRVDLGVRRVERLGGRENGLALALEALRQAVDLIEQAARDVAQRAGLIGQDIHSLGRLRSDLFGRLLHHLRVVGENLVELHRLRGKRLANRARMFGQHLVRLRRVLTERGFDDLQTFGEGVDHVLSALVHDLVEGLRLLFDRRLEALRLVEQSQRQVVGLAGNHLHECVGALGESLVEGNRSLIDRRRELRSAVGKVLVDDGRLSFDGRSQGVGALRQSAIEVDRSLRHDAGQCLRPLCDRIAKLGSARRDCRVQSFRPVRKSLLQGHGAFGDDVGQRAGLVLEGAFQNDRAFGDDIGEGTCALLQGPIQRHGAICDNRVERVRLLRQQLVECDGTLGGHAGEGLRLLRQQPVEGHGAFGRHVGEGLRIVRQSLGQGGIAVGHNGAQRVRLFGKRRFERDSALGDKVRELVGLIGERIAEGDSAFGGQVRERVGVFAQSLVQRNRALGNDIRERVGAFREGLVENNGALRHRGLESLDAFGERCLQRLRTILHGVVQKGRLLRHGGFERRQVLGGGVDDFRQTALFFRHALDEAGNLLGNLRLRELDLLGGFVGAGDEEFGELRPALRQLLIDRSAGIGDVARDLCADAFQGLAHTLAVVGERLALRCQLVDQIPDTQFVLAIGALKRGDLVVHHGFELGSPANGA